MTFETILLIGGQLAALLLLAVLAFRRPAQPGPDPVLLQALSALQSAQERQGERLAILQGAIKTELAEQAGRLSREISGFTLEQTKALKDGLLELRGVLSAQEKAVLARLAESRDAETERMGLLRRDLTQGVGELRTGLAEGQRRIEQALAAETTKSRDLLDAKLRELRESNEQRLSEIQKAVNEQLHSAVEKQMNESFARVIDQFTAVQKAMADVQAVTLQIGDIKRLFSNVKTRGGWGEAQLRALLDDILPPGGYETNVRLREDSAEAVEFALLMPAPNGERVYLAVDAKFPSEDFERLLTASELGDAEAEQRARNALIRRVRDEAAKIAAKYICPPRTVEFGVLYLPTEGLYAEVARADGLLEELSRLHRILVLGPSLLPALLRTIQIGHMTIALGQKADLVRELLGATKAEMGKMDEVLGRLAKQVGTTGRTIEEARRRTRAVARKLKGVDAIDLTRASELLELEAEMAEEEAEEVS